MTVKFELEGQTYVALNGGPHFKFNEAISLQVHCETQAEVDDYWRKGTSLSGRDGLFRCLRPSSRAAGACPA
jgi:predicted 3-demethylubiquinone-9 3-methyltransferase (glyoxalase superfamily)